MLTRSQLAAYMHRARTSTADGEQVVHSIARAGCETRGIISSIHFLSDFVRVQVLWVRCRIYVCVCVCVKIAGLQSLTLYVVRQQVCDVRGKQALRRKPSAAPGLRHCQSHDTMHSYSHLAG